MTSIEMLTKLQ